MAQQNDTTIDLREALERERARNELAQTALAALQLAYDDRVEQIEREATDLRVELLNLKTTFDVERTTRLAAERAGEQARRERDDLRQQLRQALDENQSLMRQADGLRA